MDIRVEMTQLNELADSMKASETALESIRDALEAAGKGSDGWWLGLGRSAYDQLCTKRCEEVESMLDLVKSNKESLRAAVNAYVAEEGQLVQSIGELATDDIF